MRKLPTSEPVAVGMPPSEPAATVRRARGGAPTEGPQIDASLEEGTLQNGGEDDGGGKRSGGGGFHIR